MTMPRTCVIGTSGGKGNLGMFIERDRNICAAGVPSAQPNVRVGDCLKHYLFQEEVDALIRDSIEPPPKPPPLPPLRKPIPLDMRNAGLFGEGTNLINPPNKTKFQQLVDDFKDTTYTSYWKKQVGKLPDPTSMLPEGFDIYAKPFGRKNPPSMTLYDVVMPHDPFPEPKFSRKTDSRQIDRKYCRPAFDPDKIFGHKTHQDSRGTLVKCSLVEERILGGLSLAKPISTIQANYKEATESKVSVSLTPNNNIDVVPKNFTFGKLEPAEPDINASLTTCEMNPEKAFFKSCLGHLNTIRKCLGKRVTGTFYQTLYLSLKYKDKQNTGWLPKKVVYDYCNKELIRFDPALMEPLLSMWNCFNGSEIEYKTFVRIINHRIPSPDIPKIWDVAKECINFSTTYSEMVKPGQNFDTRPRAGLPSGRYFDKDFPVTPANYCKADRTYLPEESDVRSCLFPSVLSCFGITHRDMYATREQEFIRKIFANIGDNFSDEEFNALWKDAQKYHSKGLVCIETFRRALGSARNADKKKK